MCKHTQDIEFLKNKVQNLELKLAVYALEERLDMLEEIVIEMQETQNNFEEDEQENEPERKFEDESEYEAEDLDQNNNKNKTKNKHKNQCPECGC